MARHPSVGWLQLAALFTWALSPVQVGRAEWVDQDNYGSPFGELAWHSINGTGSDQYSTLSSLVLSSDPDGDTLNNEQEAVWGTDPYNPDTDGDGHTDGGEVFYDYTNPAVWNYFTPPSATDADYDGFDDNSDPAPSDSANYSSINQSYWYADALNDADNDGTSNFSDPSPWPDDPTADFDQDGILDGIDPSPQDWMNYSNYNAITWYGMAMGDSDGDGAANYYDVSPYDSPPSNDADDSPPDQDADSIPDGTDPEPLDSTNTSPINGVSWHGTANDNSDNDGFSNFFDPAPDDGVNYSSWNNTIWDDTAMEDADNDGQANFFDTDPWPAPPTDSPGVASDTDGDGLTDDEESGYGTNPLMIDTDLDGLTDFEELSVYYINPLDAYSIHLASFATTPNLMDYYLVDGIDNDEGVGDGIPDRIETYYGLNPSDSADAFGDLDGNGVTNFDQYQVGIPLNAHLTQFDGDLDGMITVFEERFQLNDGLFQDSVEDPDNDGLFNFEEAALVLNPRTATSRSFEGTPIDDWSVLLASGRLLASDNGSRVSPGDWDADGLPDAWEHRYGLESNPAGGMKIRTPDATADYDGDGVTNAQEFTLGFNPLIQETHVGINDSDFDRDGDGLSDSYELLNGLDFASATSDADGDGVSDAQEILDGTDPKNGASNLSSLVGLRVLSPWHFATQESSTQLSGN